MCYNVWNRIFAENAPKILKKIHQNMKEFLNKTKTQLQNVYSIHGSVVERQLSIRGGACSSPCNSIIFKLGLSLSSDENAAGLELAGHLE